MEETAIYWLLLITDPIISTTLFNIAIVAYVYITLFTLTTDLEKAAY